MADPEGKKVFLLRKPKIGKYIDLMMQHETVKEVNVLFERVLSVHLCVCVCVHMHTCIRCCNQELRNGDIAFLYDGNGQTCVASLRCKGLRLLSMWFLLSLS